MAIRKILQNGEETLRKTSKPVDSFDEKLSELLGDLHDTLKKERYGVGLAAPQVGVLRRVCLVTLQDKTILEMVNPKILKESSAADTWQEACFSVRNTENIPNHYVTRPKRIKVAFYDRSGAEQVKELSGFIARCACHEIDHLDGILYIDKAETDEEKLKIAKEREAKYFEEEEIEE